MQGEAIRLRIRESRLRAGLSLATPPLLVVMAWGAYLVDSPVFVTAILAILAAALGYIVLFDFPLSIDINDEGIRRNCLLLSRLIDWDEMEGITRPKRRGLTVATNSGKQIMLIDRSLDSGELDLIETQARLRHVKTVL